jgi:hypothetical protein
MNYNLSWKKVKFNMMMFGFKDKKDKIEESKIKKPRQDADQDAVITFL